MAIKFVFTAVAQAGQDLQLQEVELFGPDGQLNITSASNPYGESVNGQDASKAIDGNKVDKWSKFLDLNMDARGNSTLVLELSSAQMVTAYELWTANDKPLKRDPQSWEVYRAPDGLATTEGWVLVDSQSGVAAPAARYTSYGRVDLRMPPLSPPPFLSPVPSPPSPHRPAPQTPQLPFSPPPSSPPSPPCHDTYVSDNKPWLVDHAGTSYTGNLSYGCDYFVAVPALCVISRVKRGHDHDRHTRPPFSIWMLPASSLALRHAGARALGGHVSQGRVLRLWRWELRAAAVSPSNALAVCPTATTASATATTALSVAAPTAAARTSTAKQPVGSVTVDSAEGG